MAASPRSKTRLIETLTASQSFEDLGSTRPRRTDSDGQMGESMENLDEFLSRMESPLSSSPPGSAESLPGVPDSKRKQPSSKPSSRSKSQEASIGRRGGDKHPLSARRKHRGDKRGSIQLRVILQQAEAVHATPSTTDAELPVFTIRVSPQARVRDVMFKIASKSELYVVTSNRRFGMRNYDIVLIQETDSMERKLDLSQRITDVEITSEHIVAMRPKERKIIRLMIEIAQYEQLKCAMKTGALLFEESTAAEALHHLARKGSILIPQKEEQQFGLFKGGKQIPPTRELRAEGLKDGDLLVLARKTDHRIALTVLISDYEELNCVRKTSHLFNAETTAAEACRTIAHKPNINIPENKIDAYELIVLTNGNALAPEARLGESGISYGDSVILRKGALKFDNMQISDFKILEMIGRGSFGKVYSALYHGHEVAVKIMPLSRSQDLQSEWKLMAEMQHESIVKFFGKLEDQHQAVLVMENCDGGSLFHLLQDRVVEVGWDRFFSFARDLFAGLEYLHGHTPHAIMHRDVKSLNLLITRGLRAKLCDFGQSREARVENSRTMHKMRGTPAWSPPELIQSKAYTPAADVYSAGITLWEVAMKTLTNRYERPMAEYKELVLDVQIMIAASKGKRPTIPASAPARIVDVITSCWETAPIKRPRADAVLETLAKLQADYEENVKQWDTSRKTELV